MTGEPLDPNDPESHFLEQYERLRAMARALVRKEADGCSVEATALVHDAYEKVFLASSPVPDFKDETHVLRTIVQAMRRILVDRARRRRTVKHGGRVEMVHVDLTKMAAPDVAPGAMLELNEALERLATTDAESARLVEMHWFAGFTIKEVANELGCSKSRADSIWLFARKWLGREMSTMGSDGDADAEP